ncbi:NAD-P-binding protein [Cubamyces sp. BRFM 1775]|nr:NAD-P-binding protein [Cubamyces sp. BRFM 1775]
MTTNKVSIFLTGATGYIGGSILQRLLVHPNANNFEITALVRSGEKAEVLESQFGVKTVLGSLQDSDKLTQLVADAHITINTAECDNVEAITAILLGLKQHHEKTGDVPHIIHTSGTGEFIDDARGEFASETVYSDLDIPTIEALPPSAPHRPVDLLVVAADAEDRYARTHIVMPSVVYGVAKGPLVDAGVMNPHTIIVPIFVRGALKRGNVGVMGKGITRWGNVHIDDLADLYIRMVDVILEDPATEKISHGREGYFFADNGELSMRSVLEAIADPLFTLGRISTRELVPYAPGEAGQYLVDEVHAGFLFTNSRTKGRRARRDLGCVPKHTAQDFLDGLREEVEVLVRKEDDAKASTEEP